MSDNLLSNQRNYDAFKQFLSNWGLAGKSAEEIKNALLSSYKAYPNDIRVSIAELSNEFKSDENLISDIVQTVGNFQKRILRR